MTLAPAPSPAPDKSRPASARTRSGLVPSPRAGRPAFITFLLCFELALCLVYLLNFAFPIPSGTFLRLVDIDGESSIANWYSSVKFFAIGALFFFFAFRNVDRARVSSWPLVLFPLLFFAMSADESVQVHEWLGRKTDALLPGGDRDGTAFHITGIWMFALGLPFLASVLSLIYCTRRFFLPAPGVTLKFVVGFCIFLAGAGGVEILTNIVPDPASLGFRLEVFAEELLEMWGATIILWAVYDLLVANRFSLNLEATS